ncbi:hypothetical protein TPY_1177 [Sulfobacillus acidophilus TPY]|uniref:Uncharacterized protein n=1 Tax=Sulfobacillus acidophilus (strain ATCC 700253 / DSM 10332 / NAL) TaxID=679936 RepID=G8TW11_SULAD|nr:hypothetical protein TPY_1177 [Sulfobacillus acidophilus TPY]AEW05938.1 hypothetical protein Sulac_2475 [Sulfobacillus acidophilus DSM 10332]
MWHFPADDERQVPVDELKPVPLTRAEVRGWIRWSFWGLRLYIAVMLVLVVIGFLRGLH